MMELKRLENEKIVDREKVLDEIKRAADEEYETIWDNGGRITQQKKKSKIKRGKASKAKGGIFELRVRKDLIERGWVVDKWSNNIDLELGEMHPAKRKYNPFSKALTIGTGFPDFVCFEKRGDLYKVIGVEVKINGTLSRIEKEKCAWYLKNEVFNEILIASKAKEKNRVRVTYVDFLEVAGRMR